MPVRLNITMDDEVYRNLKRQVKPKGLSTFITEAVRTHLLPDEATLDAAYAASARERATTEVSEEWATVDVEGWPE